MTPSVSITPARCSSAITSMIPDPQIPVTAPKSKPGSSDHISWPMTEKRDSNVARSTRTRSMAPGAARCPDEICAPSKAGPVGLEAASRRSLIPQHQLGVGADVYQQLQTLATMRALRQHRPGGVGADMAGDARKRIDPSATVGAQPEVGCGSVEGRRGDQSEGSGAQLPGVEPEDQVVHDRVADEAQLEDVIPIDPGLGDQLFEQIVESVPHHFGESCGPVIVHHHVRNATHEILTKADLGIHRLHSWPEPLQSEDHRDGRRSWSSPRRRRPRGRDRGSRARSRSDPEHDAPPPSRPSSPDAGWSADRRSTGGSTTSSLRSHSCSRAVRRRSRSPVGLARSGSGTST